MDKRKLVIGLLVVGFYIDTCLAIITMIHLPPSQLPSFNYPIQPSYFQHERNPYEKDCWGVENNYCWWYSHET